MDVSSGIAIGSIADRCRELFHDLSHFTLRGLYRAIRPCSVLDITELYHLPTSECRQSSRIDGYRIEVVDSAGLDDLAERSNLPDTLLANADFDDDRRIVLAVCDDAVVAHLCVVAGAVAAQENFSRTASLGTSLDLTPGTGFIFNAWTSPEHRGRRIMGSLAAYSVRHRVLECWALLTCVDWTNASSRKAFERLGMKSLGQIWRLGWGPFQLTVFPRSARRLGLQIASESPGWKLAF